MSGCCVFEPTYTIMSVAATLACITGDQSWKQYQEMHDSYWLDCWSRWATSSV